MDTAVANLSGGPTESRCHAKFHRCLISKQHTYTEGSDGHNLEVKYKFSGLHPIQRQKMKINEYTNLTQESLLKHMRQSCVSIGVSMMDQ